DHADVGVRLTAPVRRRRFVLGAGLRQRQREQYSARGLELAVVLRRKTSHLALVTAEVHGRDDEDGPVGPPRDVVAEGPDVEDIDVETLRAHLGGDTL